MRHVMFLAERLAAQLARTAVTEVHCRKSALSDQMQTFCMWTWRTMAALERTLLSNFLQLSTHDEYLRTCVVSRGADAGRCILCFLGLRSLQHSRFRGFFWRIYQKTALKRGPPASRADNPLVPLFCSIRTCLRQSKQKSNTDGAGLALAGKPNGAPSMDLAEEVGRVEPWPVLNWRHRHGVGGDLKHQKPQLRLGDASYDDVPRSEIGK